MAAGSAVSTTRLSGKGAVREITHHAGWMRNAMSIAFGYRITSCVRPTLLSRRSLRPRNGQSRRNARRTACDHRTAIKRSQLPGRLYDQHVSEIRTTRPCARAATLVQQAVRGIAQWRKGV